MAFRSLFSMSFLLPLLLLLAVLKISASPSSFSSSFYASTCPKALSTIRTVVRNAVADEHRMGASLLRLHFHDCFVNGCDASVLLDDTSSFTGEKTAGANKNSLRGFEVIDAIKTQLEDICPAVVSCADILAVAARESVVALGGPTWAVQLGRRDSTTASLVAANSNSNIPSPLMDLTDILPVFTNKGFTPKEMVALLGSHTIGQARCLTFRNRIYNESQLIDASFATTVRTDCPISLGLGDDNLTALDASSPSLFDNSYYQNLVKNKGLLHSDQQLYSGGSTDSHVITYGNDFVTFFVDFANAMVKMGNLSLLTGTSGQIRTNCRKIN